MSGYRPLASLSIPGVSRFAPSGLLLIVGPNSSGKTQLLRDVHNAIIGEQRELVVSDSIHIERPNHFEDFLTSQETQGYFQRKIDTNNQELVRQVMPHYGLSTSKGLNIQLQQMRQAYEQCPARIEFNSNVNGNAFLQQIGQCLSTVLFLENRLIATNQVNHFDWEKQPPENDLQALFLNAGAKKRLSDEIGRTFGRGVWLDNSRGNILCLRVTGEGADIPSAEQRNEPSVIRRYRTIETEGDGIRSFTAIAVALLLGRRPLCLIDEPELCLHPPQATAIGRFIGQHGISPEHATLVATHSSHVLRGVIDTTSQVEILRLTRIGEHFAGHLIDHATLQDCIHNPLVRAETILDGIFADGVTIVEADGDRTVYQAARESSQDSYDRDILFIPVGGTGAIRATATFYKVLRIPVAVIADLDIITDDQRMSDLLAAMSDEEVAKSIRVDCQKVAKKIRSIPPSLSVDELKERVTLFMEKELNWSQDDDEEVLRTLQGLTNDLSRMRRLKRGGVKAFTNMQDIDDDLLRIINACEKIGIFLVSVGELEYWCEELMAGGPGKSRKAAWANEAAKRIREHPEQAKDIREFVEKIDAYHRDQATALLTAR